ncbi:acyl-CoA N-acyltransferase [Aspergillus varians]
MSPAPTNPATTTTIIPATPNHTAPIKSLIKSAFTKYIDRMGKPPAPMLAEYTDLRGVFVLIPEHNPSTSANTDTDTDTNTNTILGTITITESSDTSSLKINNLAVAPAAHGLGYGRRLVEFAERRARELGRGRVILATNVKMVENLGLYARLGFVETGRGVEDGFERVFLGKDLLEGSTS